MEFSFQRNTCSCLQKVLEEVQNMEQSQEIRIPEGMPGIDHVVSAWGQPVMRGKEWQSDSVGLSAGMMVWVMYISEEGSQACLEGWIPFQLRWDLPQNSVDGNVLIQLLPRYVEARSVSARKILVRAGMAAMAQGWCSGEQEVYSPEETPPELELLTATYPVQLPKESGERQFHIEEALVLPGSAPVPQKLVYYRMHPVISDRKVLSNRAVFRGNGNLHVLYQAADGQLYNWDFELPFSQFADLKGSFSQDAQVDFRIVPNHLELEIQEDGKLHLKSTMVAQYLVDDREMLRLTEDAYSPGREVSLHQKMLELPVVLEKRQENIYGEQTLPADANLIVDTTFVTEFPRQHRESGVVNLELSGMVQILYYGADGFLQSASGKWLGQTSLKMDDSSQINVAPVANGEIQVVPAVDAITVKGNVPLAMTVSAGQGLPMVTGVEMGEANKTDPSRPTLVIRRMDGSRLWDVAKENGSTISAIQQINALEEEPAKGKLLLIPVM